jgi:hypothetical protein
VEKRTPHYNLKFIQVEVARLGAAAFTKTAWMAEGTWG